MAVISERLNANNMDKILDMLGMKETATELNTYFKGTFWLQAVSALALVLILFNALKHKK